MSGKQLWMLLMLLSLGAVVIVTTVVVLVPPFPPVTVRVGTITFCTKEPAPETYPQTTVQAARSVNAGLDGYCPVTLIDQRVWKRGNTQWGAEHEGQTYIFAGSTQQKKFLRDPHIYGPLLQGCDLVEYAETGAMIPGRRECGLYLDGPGPIALFSSEANLEKYHTNYSYYYAKFNQGQSPQLTAKPNEQASK